MAAWRSIVGIGAFTQTNGATSPDLRYWQNSGGSSSPGGN
jgi:hypothetical protein